MHMKAFLVAFAAAFCVAADAAGPYWLKAAFDNSKSTGAYKDAAAWEDAGGTASGASGAALDDTATYNINNGRVMRASTEDTWEFGGNSLVLGDSGSVGTILLYGHNKTYEFPRGGLILSNGYITAHGAYNRSFAVNGEITVADGTEESPVSRIQISYSNSQIRLAGTLKGSENAVLDVGALSAWGKSYFNNGSRVVLESDCSDFLGLINMKAEKSNNLTEPYSWLSLVFAPSSVFGGRLKMNAGTFLKPADTTTLATLGSLDLCAGTTVDFFAGGLTNSQLVVTNALTVEEGVTLRLTEKTLLTHTNTVFLPLITAPAANITGEVADKFSLEANISNTAWTVRLGIRDAGGGARVLGVELPPLVYLKKGDNNGKGFDLGESSSWTALTNELSWSDGMVPHAGAHYRVEGVGSSERSLRTKWDESPYTFAGDSLTFGRRGKLIICGQSKRRTFNCTNLYFEAGSELVSVQNAAMSLPFGFTLTSPSGAGEAAMRSFTGQRMDITGEVHGTGDMVLRGNYPSGSPQGFYYFSAMNTNWFGRMRLDHDGLDPYRITNYYWQTVYVSDERNLGGRLAEFDWKALTLGVSGAIRTYDTTPVTLTTNYNRGVFVDYIGHFDVYRASHKFTVNTQITMNGLLRKIGPGLLTMGGTVKFLGEDGEPGDIPRATSNIFEIAEGKVVVASARACDGMAITFTDGAQLELKLDPADPEMLGCGLRNTKTDTPFVLADGMAKLPLSLDWSSVSKPEIPVTVGVVTVSNSADTVAAVGAMLPEFRSPWGGVRSELVPMERPDEGSVTFALKLCPVGIRFIVR